jgi:glycogen phosphorylase
VEDVTGWSIGDWIESCIEPSGDIEACHAAALYDKLEQKVLPCYYNDRERFIEIMRHAIDLNGGFFNTQRMMAQYLIMRADWSGSISDVSSGTSCSKV